MTKLICNKCGGEFPDALEAECLSNNPESEIPQGVCSNDMGFTIVEEPPVEEPTEE